MPEFKSDTYQAQETASERAGKMISDAAFISGFNHNIQMTATVPAGTAAGDTILMGFLPRDLRVGIGSVIHCSVAGGATIDLGFAVTTDEPDAATALASDVPTAAGTAFVNATQPVYQNAVGRRPVVATLDGALTAGAVITVSLACSKGE